MKRIVAALFMSLFVMNHHAVARDVMVISGVDSVQSSARIQITPGEKMLELDLRSGPGYVIVRQRGLTGGTVIIHRTAPVDGE